MEPARGRGRGPGLGQLQPSGPQEAQHLVQVRTDDLLPVVVDPCPHVDIDSVDEAAPARYAQVAPGCPLGPAPDDVEVVASVVDAVVEHGHRPLAIVLFRVAVTVGLGWGPLFEDEDPVPPVDERLHPGRGLVLLFVLVFAPAVQPGLADLIGLGPGLFTRLFLGQTGLSPDGRQPPALQVPDHRGVPAVPHLGHDGLLVLARPGPRDARLQGL